MLQRRRVCWQLPVAEASSPLIDFRQFVVLCACGPQTREMTRMILFLTSLALIACVSVVASGPNTPLDESEDAITFEAADLSDAHPPELENEVNRMESLLHWAIGEVLSACAKRLTGMTACKP